MLTLLVSLSLLACPGDDPSATKGDGSTAPVTAPAKKQGLDAARAAMAEGDAPGALKEVEAWLAQHPDDDAAWDLAELAALRANDAGGLVDRLSADQALGGRAERHHVLRGALALVARRPADALVAAKALTSVAPGDAAALVAGAAKLGAPPPAGLDAATLALLAAQSDVGSAIDPLVDALPGWRVALVRAELRVARGDAAAARAELGRVPAGLPRLQALPLALQIADDDAARWAAAETGARDALTAGDPEGAAQALDLGLPAALATWKAEGAYALANELRKAAETAKNAEGAAAVAAVEARAALHAGMPLTARSAAAIAVQSTRSKARGGWEASLAEAALGNAAAIELLLPNLAEPEATAARELAAALRGVNRLPGAGLDPERAALVAMLAAGWLDDPTPAYAAGARASAADVRTWALAWADEAALPAPGSEKTPPTDPGPSWTGEHHARLFLTGKGSEPVPGDHPDAASWNAIIRNEPGQAGPGVSTWPRARQALASNDTASAAREYGALSLAVPHWRTGPWRPVLVLDGPPPHRMSADAELIRNSADPFTPAVTFHGWSARRNAVEALWHAGASPFAAAVTPEQRAATWDAAARYRVRSLQWLAGAGPFPVAERDALASAEKAAGLNAFQSPNVTALRSGLDNAAIISFRTLPEAVEVLYVTPSGGKIRTLKTPTGEAMASWTRSLYGGEAAVNAGDKIREAVLDNAQDVLTGTGRLILVGAPPYGTLSINALPEQRDGLRFLADIRSVAYYPDLDAIAAPLVKAPEEYQQTLVALCANPLEADLMRRIYPQAMVLEGPQATVAAWKANAAVARFVHIGDFPAGASGGWQLADGELSVGDLAATPLTARGGYIGGGPDANSAYARMVAAQRAGLLEFLVGGPSTDPTFHERMQNGFWEGLNRRYSASRSFYDARATALKSGGETANKPSNWARYLVYGRP